MHDHFGKLVCDNLDEVLQPARCALVVVDMQNDLLDRNGAYAANGENIELTRAIIPNLLVLIEAARSTGVLVLYTQNTTLPAGRSDSPAWAYFKSYSRPALGGEYTVAGTWGHELIPELDPRAGEPVVQKHRSDAFIGTDLDQLLRANRVETVVVAGVVTNGCVESTLRHAAFNDYYAALVGDGCASTSQRKHELALELLAARHDVVSTDTVRRAWGF